MNITNQEKNVTTLVSNDSHYFVTKHSCPKCECELFTCSCPNFQMGITHRGGNPFVSGCKHIKFVQEEAKKTAGGSEE